MKIACTKDHTFGGVVYHTTVVIEEVTYTITIGNHDPMYIAKIDLDNLELLSELFGDFKVHEFKAAIELLGQVSKCAF